MPILETQSIINIQGHILQINKFRYYWTLLTGSARIITLTEAFPGVSKVIRSVKILFPLSLIAFWMFGCSENGIEKAIRPYAFAWLTSIPI